MNILLNAKVHSPSPLERPAEMAVWDPDADPVDPERALRELDRRGMALLSHVGLATLVLAVVSSLVTVMS